MRKKLGRYQILSHHFHRRILTPITPEKEASLLHAVDRLSQVLGESGWEIGGGLSIPLTIGHFYRVHNDIDINIKEDHFSALVHQAAINGYALFTRPLWLRTGMTRKIDVYRACTADEALSHELRHLRLVRVDARGWIVPQLDILDHIDVFIYGLDGDTLRYRAIGLKYPRSEHLGPTHVTRSGRRVAITHLKIVRRIKARGFGEVDRCDKRYLRKALS